MRLRSDEKGNMRKNAPLAPDGLVVRPKRRSHLQQPTLRAIPYQLHSAI